MVPFIAKVPFVVSQPTSHYSDWITVTVAGALRARMTMAGTWSRRSGLPQMKTKHDGQTRVGAETVESVCLVGEPRAVMLPQVRNALVAI